MMKDGKALQAGTSHYLGQNFAKGFEIIASFPELKGRPVFIGESDPEGCAGCSSRVYPQNAYRNGVMVVIAIAMLGFFKRKKWI